MPPLIFWYEHDYDSLGYNLLLKDKIPPNIQTRGDTYTKYYNSKRVNVNITARVPPI